MTIVEIVNVALGFLGEDAIVALTDATKRAQLSNGCYAAVRDAILEERDWQFAASWSAVATAASTSKNPRFTYKCSKPSGCLSVREVTNANGDPIEWVLDGELVLVEETVDDAAGVGSDGVYMKVTTQVTDTTKWPNGFVMAFAHRLAAVLAVPLTENRQLQAEQWQLYELAMNKAASADSMQGRPFQGPYISTLKSARNS